MALLRSGRVPVRHSDLPLRLAAVFDGQLVSSMEALLTACLATHNQKLPQFDFEREQSEDKLHNVSKFFKGTLVLESFGLGTIGNTSSTFGCYIIKANNTTGCNNTEISIVAALARQNIATRERWTGVQEVFVFVEHAVTELRGFMASLGVRSAADLASCHHRTARTTAERGCVGRDTSGRRLRALCAQGAMVVVLVVQGERTRLRLGDAHG